MSRINDIRKSVYNIYDPMFTLADYDLATNIKFYDGDFTDIHTTLNELAERVPNVIVSYIHDMPVCDMKYRHIARLLRKHRLSNRVRAIIRNSRKCNI